MTIELANAIYDAIGVVPGRLELFILDPSDEYIPARILLMMKGEPALYIPKRGTHDGLQYSEEDWRREFIMCNLKEVEYYMKKNESKHLSTLQNKGLLPITKPKGNHTS